MQKRLSLAIQPTTGVGPLRFGMSRAEVRHLIPESAEEDGARDFFSGLGMFCYYRDHHGLEAVEFAGPASPTLLGRPLLDRPLEEVASMLRELKAVMVPNDAGFTTETLGIGIFAPAGTDVPDAPVKGVIVFEEGYFGRAEHGE